MRRLIVVGLAVALLSCSAAEQLADGSAHARHCPELRETLQIGVIMVDAATDTAAISLEGRPGYSSFYFDDPRSKTGVDVEVGNNSDTRHITHYPKATHASRESLAGLGIDDRWALVELESNCGDFVSPSHVFLTSMRRLDGGEKFPLELTQVVEQLSVRNDELLAAHVEASDAALIERASAVFLRGAVDPSLIRTTTVPLLYWQGDALLADFQTRRELIEMGNPCGAARDDGEVCQTMSARVVAELLVRFTVDRTGKVIAEHISPPTISAASFPPPP